MKWLMIVEACVLALMFASTPAGAGQYDNPTPPNASAINRALHVAEPREPLADTTREHQIRATSNGGG